MTEEKNPKEEIHQELAPDRLLAKKLGTRTWLIFWWQVGTFGVGILFAIVAVLTVIGHNLV